MSYAFDDLVFRFPQVGQTVYFTGTLHSNSNGGKEGKSFINYPCYIVDIRSNAKYPVLLGDNYTDELGWVSVSSITYRQNIQYL